MRSSKFSKILAEIVLAVTGQAEKIAQVVIFLCSDPASYIKGKHLAIDGGLIAG
jgi:NAD(P)-dependent dehydrogenase (short-subunit alcohol dehydrogenase family)